MKVKFTQLFAYLFFLASLGAGFINLGFADDANPGNASSNTSMDVLDHLLPGQTLTLTLPEAIAIGLRKNSSVQQSYLTRITDKLTLEIAEQQFVPQLNASALTVNSSGNLGQPLGDSNSSTFSPGVTWKTPLGQTLAFTWGQTITGFDKNTYTSTPSLVITQPLMQGFGTEVNEIDLNNAYDTELKARIALKTSVISVITTTIIPAYRGLQSAQMTLESDRLALKAANEAVFQTQENIKAGVAPPSDIYQVQATAAQAQISIQTDLNSLLVAQATLANAIGLNDQIKLKVPDTIDVLKVVPDEALSEKLFFENNTQYLTDVISMRATKRALLSAEDKARWQVDLTATIAPGGNSNGVGNSNSNITSAPPSTGAVGNSIIGPQSPGTGSGSNIFSAYSGNSVGLSVTIPVGEQAQLANESAITGAKIGIQQAQIALDSEKMQQILNIKTSIASINSSWESIILNKQAVELQEKTLEITQKKVRAGLASNFELSTQLQTVATARNSLITAEIAYLNDLSTFDQLLGTTLETWHVKVNY